MRAGKLSFAAVVWFRVPSSVRPALFWEKAGREEHAVTQQVVPMKEEEEEEERRQKETDRETAREGEKERGIAQASISARLRRGRVFLACLCII